MAISTPYCEIDGLVCSDVVTSIEPRPGLREMGKTKFPGKRYGRLVDQGQNPKSYLVKPGSGTKTTWTTGWRP